jgi:hypothetical protein
MRLTWKLALLLAIAVGAQWLLNRYAADLDEARFAIRVYVAHLCGGTAADTDVMDLAVDLHNRQIVRAERVATARHAATQQQAWDEGDGQGFPVTSRVNASFPSE